MITHRNGHDRKIIVKKICFPPTQVKFFFELHVKSRQRQTIKIFILGLNSILKNSFFEVTIFSL